MTDERSPCRDTRLTRRGALALGGATLLAGCGDLSNPLGTDPVELDGAALARIAGRDGPAVDHPLPVAVADDHVADSRERAHAMLASAPLPLTADDLPNGAMREAIADRAEHAREHLAEAVRETDTRERLELLAHARGPARAVEAAWGAIDDELTAADVRAARRSVRADLRRFRDECAFVGDPGDRVRAVIVHALVGSWVREAEDGLSRDRPDDDASPVTPITVGERASEVEHARATLADARHVGERFTESLTESRSLVSTVADARDSLAETIDSRMADKPAEHADLSGSLDADLEGSVAGTALRQLHGDLPYEGEFVPDTELPGRILWQIETLAQIGAFERLRDRIAAGDHRTVESAEDVEELRRAAATAVEDAVSESADERLARTELASLAGWFDYAARDLGRQAGDDPVELEWVADDIALYLQIEVIAGAVPAAVDEALAALDAA